MVLNADPVSGLARITALPVGQTTASSGTPNTFVPVPKRDGPLMEVKPAVELVLVQRRIGAAGTVTSKAKMVWVVGQATKSKSRPMESCLKERPAGPVNPVKFSEAALMVDCSVGAFAALMPM